MTDFRVSGMHALRSAMDEHASAIGSSVLAVLTSASSWPEPESYGDPYKIYAVWAKVWTAELAAIKDTLTAISTALSNLATILEQIDTQYANAFSASGP